MALNRLFANFSITPTLISRRAIHATSVSYAGKPNIVKPKPGFGKAYRRIVHFPEAYTVKPLDVTNLAGRDPETGRMIAKGIGGGIKHKYHWIDWLRDGPTEGPPQDEKVIQIIEDGCRTSHIALVAVGDKLKYILATENMKPGDILKTSRNLPRIPVRANEGDAYVLGALPTGTQVHCIEKDPGKGGLYVHAAGTFGTILRRQDDRVVVQMPSKRQFSFSQHCMAVVGRLSNVDHGSTPIGSAQSRLAAAAVAGAAPPAPRRPDLRQCVFMQLSRQQAVRRHRVTRPPRAPLRTSPRLPHPLAHRARLRVSERDSYRTVVLAAGRCDWCNLDAKVEYGCWLVSGIKERADIK